MKFETQNFIIVDNFYSNPDEVRDYALSLPYRNDVHGRHFWRTTPKLNFDVIPHLESYIGRKIAIDHYWEKHSDEDYIEMNMSFYKVVNDGGKDSIARANHIHHDWTHWSGIVYLSSDLGPEVGTQLWRHKPSGDEFAFGNPEIDDTPYRESEFDDRCNYEEDFEKTDYIAYKYNRLALFRGTLFHSAAHPKHMPDGTRLNQFFYFNVEY